MGPGSRRAPGYFSPAMGNAIEKRRGKRSRSDDARRAVEITSTPRSPGESKKQTTYSAFSVQTYLQYFNRIDSPARQCYSANMKIMGRTHFLKFLHDENIYRGDIIIGDFCSHSTRARGHVALHLSDITFRKLDSRRINCTFFRISPLMNIRSKDRTG